MRPLDAEMDDTDNDNIYLCQVSETVSCGACCGLYNLPELSRKKLESMLSQRTDSFAAVPRTEDKIFAFQRKNKGPHRLSRPFPQFHHCPFLGLIGAGKSRVGCLLHPASPGNNGVDYRFLSWYGEQACRSYFCPSARKLPAVYLSILTQTIDNWYDYGLLVTEHALLTAYFREVEFRLGRHITVSDYADKPKASDGLREFAQLKSRWPYRRDDSPSPCNFFFENGLYPRPAVFRKIPGIQPSIYENIFRELDTGFSSAEEITAADRLLDELLTKTVRAIEE